MNEYDFNHYKEENIQRSSNFQLSTKKIKKMWNHAKKYKSQSEQLQYQLMYQESIAS